MVKSMTKPRSRSIYSASLLLSLFSLGCIENEKPPISAYASGQFTIATQEDSTKDFSGFELALVTQSDGDADTLGQAMTALDGSFRMNILADEEGVYPLLVSRAGAQLALAEFVVVDGDTSSISGTFPLNGRRLRIVSPENAAWTAYRNAKSFHNRSVLDMVQSQTETGTNLYGLTRQTSALLWSLRDTYPGTMATMLASAEAIVMMEGWEDSLVAARLGELSFENTGMVGVIKAARRSYARLFGQDSSLALIRSYMHSLKDPDDVAELRTELVVAYLDSFQTEAALREALEIRRLYPDSEWARWSASATYEIENLLPGMQAPPFVLVDREGVEISSEQMKGDFLIMEFYRPTDVNFIRELSDRNTIYSYLDPDFFQTLSISVEADSVINEALFEEVDPPGRFVFADNGRRSDIAVAYNVQVLPTRFLIDPDGIIFRKYSGVSMDDLAQDIIDIVARINQLAEQNQ